MAEHPRNKPLPPRPRELEPTSSQNRRRSRRLSLPSFVQAVVPRRRPERGGTWRERGYWEALDNARDSERRESHSLPTNGPACLPLTPSSDRIVQWNTPKLIPKSRRVSSAASVTQPGLSMKPSLGRNRRRSSTFVSGFQLDNSGCDPAPETARFPTDKVKHLHRSPTPHHGCHREEMRQSQAQRALTDRVTARRRSQRRSLKESGDYLGVQGVNPLTGEPDHVTPFSSDERSELSVDTKQGHFHIPRNFTSWDRPEGARLVGEVMGRDSRRQGQRRAVADTRKCEKQTDGSQWSSAQEPNLSPIVQSSISDASDENKHRKGVIPAETDNDSPAETGPSTPVPPVEETPCNNPRETPSSSSSRAEDASSCGTVIRAEQRDLSRSPSWAQELHDNGIVFAPSNSERDIEDAGMSHELRQDTGAIGRQERHITFASPPAVPARRVTRPATSIRSLSLGHLEERGFYVPRPTPDPREDRCREAKCSETNLWIRERIPTSATPEECPFKKRLLRIALPGAASLVENRLPTADMPALVAETVSADQTLEHVVESNWSTTRSTTKSVRGLEAAQRKKRRIVISPRSTDKNPTSSISLFASRVPAQDLKQDQGEMLASSRKKRDPGAAAVSLESEPQQKESTCGTWMLKGGHEMVHQKTAGGEMSMKGPACIPITTTTGSSHHFRVDGINNKCEKVPNRHVCEALERLHKNRSKNGNWKSRVPPTPSSLSNSQIPQADTQGHDTLSIRERKRRMTKEGHLKRVLDELLTDRCVVPTSTSTSACQPSHTTAPETTTDTAAWITDLSLAMHAGKKEEQTHRHTGYHDGDGGGRAVQTSAGPRERTILMVARLIVLSVKTVRLYRQYLCSCLNPRSELWAKMQGGELAPLEPLEALAVILTVGATFYLLFGLYTVLVYFRDVLKEAWEDEMYYY